MNRNLIIQLALYMADRCPDKLERFARIVYDEWKENEHPRDEDGKFAETATEVLKTKKGNGNISKKEHGLLRLSKAQANGRFVNPHELLFRNAKNIKPIDGYEDYTCHADEDAFYIDLVGDGNEEDYMLMSPEEYAEHIKLSSSYKNGNVRIISCKAGLKPNGAAQRLADALGVTVLAPTQIVNVDENGEMFLTDSFVLSDIWYRASAEERSKMHEPGEWKVFYPKKKGGNTNDNFRHV